MKLNEVINFPSFYELVKSHKIPFKLAYRLSLLNQKVEHSIRFYQTEIEKIISQYAMRGDDGNYILTEDGNGVKIRPEVREECDAKLFELQNTEVEDYGITFTFEDFENFDVTPEEIAPILPFVQQD